MRKAFLICSALLLLSILMQSCFDLFDLPKGPHDGRLVMYPATGPMTDSIVIDSAENVSTVRYLLAGHLSDTMFLLISDGYGTEWYDTLTGCVERNEGPYDWYCNRMSVQYYSKEVSDGDSVVMTCWFGK